MKKEKGFYPWIKSIFSKKQKTNAEGVYAGPDQMKGRRRPAFTKCVYAGPPRNRKEIEAVYAGPEPMNDVYAGPEFFEPDEPVEETPTEPAENPTDPAGTPEPPAPEMPVYAGPEFFEPSEPAPEPTEPDEPPMGRVYAGPERYEKNDTPIMLVYAGPEYFNPTPRVLHGAPAPEAEPEKPAEPDDSPVPAGSVRCPACGFVYDAIFCPECGTPRPKEE